MPKPDMVPTTFVIGDLTFKAYDYRVFRGEKEVLIQQPKEHQLISYFALRHYAGNAEIVSREELANHMYPAGAASWNIVYVFMNKVRKRLKDAHSTVSIETIHGKGYKLVIANPVRQLTKAAA